ncbi:MAG: hypothetical protein JSS08_04165 [Proteobacteria bacterium]|nr:hypothetical protein [Pseudomonadota bacterium]
MLYEELAGEIREVLEKLKSGEWDGKAARHSVSEMRGVLKLVLEERNRIAELGKEDGGGTSGQELDFDAARAEIGRRLACLRDAGDG